MKVKDLLEQLKKADPDMELDLGTTLVEKKEPKIFFYERPDGSGAIVQVTASEAYSYQYETTPPWKQIGASDGEHWKEATKEIRQIVNELKKETREYTSQNLPVPKALSMKFRKAHLEFVRINARAIEEEIEIARGHIYRPPKNHLIATPEAREAMHQSKRISQE